MYKAIAMPTRALYMRDYSSTYGSKVGTVLYHGENYGRTGWNIRISNTVNCVQCSYRCETFNGVMREHNLHGNRQASSRDITTNFAVIEQLLYVCKGGVDQTGRTQVYEYYFTA